MFIIAKTCRRSRDGRLGVASGGYLDG